MYILCGLSVVLAQGQKLLQETPQQFVIFDEIGHMAAGMANIHVAIPVNLTTFKQQAKILADYLHKLTRVVDDGEREKETFMQTIRELAKFAEIRLAHIKKRIDHLDIILPFDGDLTDGQRNRRTTMMTDIQEDEHLEVHKWLNIANFYPIYLDDMLMAPFELRANFTLRIQERIRQVTHINRTFLKFGKHNRVKRWYVPSTSESRGAHERRQILQLQQQKNQLIKILEEITNETLIIKDQVDMKIRQKEILLQSHRTINIFDQIKSGIESFLTPDSKQDSRHRRHKRQVRTDPNDYRTNGYEQALEFEREDLQVEISNLLIQVTTAERLQESLKVAYYSLVAEHQHQAKNGTQQFYTLDEIFKSGFHSTDHERVKRFAPLVAVAAISGVLGTFLGIYTAVEIGILKSKLNELSKNHNLLVHVTKRHEEQIARLTENMNAICTLLKLMIRFNPSLISAQIEAQLRLFEMRLEKVYNVVQQLQHRRLAVDYLDTYQLSEMHQAVTDIAEKRGYTLLPERLSDYFQLEASYLRQGEDILIILHVPCIVHDQMLTLYRYIPFPYPIPKRITSDKQTIEEMLHQIGNKNSTQSFPKQILDEDTIDALILVPEADLIAIGSQRRYRTLSNADLSACNQRNRVYLCEKHQVLHTEMADSCLGSIFDRNEIGVKNNCKVERKKLKETIYQISPTDYLLFTPHKYTTQIQCKNGTNFPLYLSQTTKFHLPEDCRVSLQAFSIQSDYNIRISPEPLNVPWQWDPLTLPSELLLDAAIIDEKINRLDDNLRKLLNDTSHKTDFEAMLNTSFSDPTYYPWFIWVSILLAVLGLLLLIFWYCYNHRQARQQQQQGQQPPISLQLITASAPQQQQPINLHRRTHSCTVPKSDLPQNLYPNPDSMDDN